MNNHETLNNIGEDETETLSDTSLKLDAPPLYRVVVLNDDFTPMEFVVDLLIRFFQKSLESATQTMLNIHHKGLGVCGVYPREIAETKVMQVNQHARKHDHPLRCRMEPN